MRDTKLVIILAITTIQVYNLLLTETKASLLFHSSSNVNQQSGNITTIDNDPNEPASSSLLSEDARKLSNQVNRQQTAVSLSNDHKRLFVVDLLKMLHEEYGKQITKTIGSQKQQQETLSANRKEDRNNPTLANRQAVMNQLLGAINSGGDLRRLVDWVQNSFNLASVGELTTQFVVSKLGSVNCAALFKPDNEETLIPRFLLFNEHFVDVPFELPINPSASQCIVDGKFDPLRKTVILLHGYLAGYTLVDGLTNIKNRLLDLNKFVNERAMNVFVEASQNNGSYVLTEDIEFKVKQQQYNVIIVDWFNGANPVPRSRYIKAATNAQVVGNLIARFLSALVVKCRTPARQIQIIAHSLGCHVAGFTGKAMNAAGHRLGKITHLDPIGLCFGRLFSEPKFRLSPNDAIDTQAVHVSLNLFDNPLDGAQSNFLVNGGRDQIGCGHQSELKNSTSSSVSIVFDNRVQFKPCSHIRAVSLYEDDLSSEPGQCQIVGYRCATYERFMSGKCGKCDATNAQCRLMSLAPVFSKFNKMSTQPMIGRGDLIAAATTATGIYLQPKNYTEINEKIGNTIARMEPELVVAPETARWGQPSILKINDNFSRPGEVASSVFGTELLLENNSNISFADDEMIDYSNIMQNNGIKRATRRLTNNQRDRSRISQTIDKIKVETRNALVNRLTNFRSGDLRYKLGSLTMDKLPLQMASISIDSDNKLLSLGLAQAKTTAKQVGNSETAEQLEISQPPEAPLGSQALPVGSVNGPIYFTATGPVSPYCVNYYQFRLLIAESRIEKLLRGNSLAPNRLAQISALAFESLLSTNELSNESKQSANVNDKDMLHLTIKLLNSEGHFFKGFTLLEDVKSLVRIRRPAESRHLGQPTIFNQGDNMVELTMLLNTTHPKPIRISEAIISYYFHEIVLADMVEVNYMSNISPEVRASYSSVLCPMAINDQHKLVRYIDCDKIATKRR